MSPDHPRLPRLHPPVPTESFHRTITFWLSDGRCPAIRPMREVADAVFAEMTVAINEGRAITIKQPDGSAVVLNSAHIVSMDLR